MFGVSVAIWYRLTCMSDATASLFGFKPALVGPLLFEQCLVFSLELGVNQRTPLRADLPLQLVWAAKGIPEAPARLPTNVPVRRGIGSLVDGVVERLPRLTLLRVPCRGPLVPEVNTLAFPGGQCGVRDGCWCYSKGVNPRCLQLNGRKLCAYA